MALVTTPGSASANSFATVAEFRAYQANRLPAIAWTVSATDAACEVALIAAGRLLDALFTWTGLPVDDVQAMTWPRSGMFTRNNFPILTTVIPVDLKNAQCEMAGQLGNTDLLADNDPIKQGIASVKAGSVAVSFKNLDTASPEAVDMLIRRMSSELQWASDTVPQAVRQLLVASWFAQPSIKRPLFFEAF